MKKDNPISMDMDDSNRIKQDSSGSKRTEKSLLSSKIAKSGLRKNKAKTNQRKGLIVIGLLVLIFFILLFVVIYKLPEAPKTYEDDNLTPIDTANITDLLKFEAHESSRYHAFSDKLVYLSQDQLAIKNYSGENIYQEQIDFKRPVSVQNENYFLAGDRSSGQILVLDNRTKKFSLRLDGVFAGAFFGREQFLAVIDENPDRPGYVHIIDLATGDKKLTLQFVESGYPLAVSFSNSLDFFDVLLINTKGSRLQTIIKRYDLEGNQLGQKIPANNPFLYGKIFHDQYNNIVIASTTNVLALNLEQEQPIAEYAPGKIFDLLGHSKLTSFASSHLDGEIKIANWNAEGKSFDEVSINAGSGFNNFTYLNNLIGFYNNNQVKIYDQNRNNIILDQTINADIVRIGFNGNQLVLITEQGVKVLDF